MNSSALPAAATAYDPTQPRSHKGLHHLRVKERYRRRWRGRKGRREGGAGRETAALGGLVVVPTESFMGRPKLLTTRVLPFLLPALPVRRPLPLFLVFVGVSLPSPQPSPSSSTSSSTSTTTTTTKGDSGACGGRRRRRSTLLANAATAAAAAPAADVHVRGGMQGERGRRVGRRGGNGRAAAAVRLRNRRGRAWWREGGKEGGTEGGREGRREGGRDGGNEMKAGYL